MEQQTYSGMLANTFSRNAKTVSVVMGSLAVLIIVLIGYTYKYKKEANKAGFGISGVHNLNTGGMNPMWWIGSEDAGWGGAVHRESTLYNMAISTPGLRAAHIGRRAGAPNTSREGFKLRRRDHFDGSADPAAAPIDLSTAGLNPGPCLAGMTPVTYVDPDGTQLTRCVSSGPSVVADPTAILAACGATWDPAATAEAQALATVGSFQHDAYGERKLQNAINAAYDSNVGLTDAQMAEVMAGGSP